MVARSIEEIEAVAMDGASIFSLVNALVSSRRSTFYQDLSAAGPNLVQVLSAFSVDS